MLAVLGDLADVERDLIRTRTAQCRNRAKARERLWAARFPHTHTGTAERRHQAARAQGATLDELALSYNVSWATISRLT